MRPCLRPRVLALGASSVLCACVTQQSSISTSARGTDVVRAQIEQADVRFSDAYNRGDVVAVAAMYDVDAVVLAPNAPPMRGRQNIEAFWGGARQQGIKSVNLVVTSVEVSGDHAIELGNYTLAIQPPSGPEISDRGKYMVVWKRQADGTWKLYRDMFNTSMPR